MKRFANHQRGLTQENRYWTMFWPMRTPSIPLLENDRILFLLGNFRALSGRSKQDRLKR